LRAVYDVILKEIDPQLVKLEMDIYWVVRAGHDCNTAQPASGPVCYGVYKRYG
jgi:hypothetical protein